MGSDTDPTGKGRPEGSSAEASHEADGPAPVDFDALHAALGSMPPPEVTSSPELPQPRGLTLEKGPSESMGRSSATYASASPHAVPKAHVASEAPDIPAVIVHAEDTAPTPTAPAVPLGAKMTVPMAPPPAHSSGPHPAAPSYPFTPPPFPVQAIPNSSHTIRMPERPRRGRVPTIVVRPRGPSTRQKLAAFIVMFLLFTAGGVALLVVLRPNLLGLDKALGVAPATSAAPSAASTVTATMTATVIATTTAVPSATAPLSTAPPASAATPAASVKPKPKPTAPKPVPTAPP